MHSSEARSWPPTQPSWPWPGLVVAHRVPRPRPFLSSPGRGQEQRAASRERGCQRVGGAPSPDAVMGPVDPGPLAHYCFAQLQGLAGPTRLELTTAQLRQSWQGQRRQLSLANAGTHMTQVMASYFKCLTLCSHIRPGTSKAPCSTEA